MLPKHVLDFVNPEIERRQIKRDETVREYNKCVAEYKALPAIKRFFTSHPETAYYWDFGEYRLNELIEIRRQAEYKHKMEQMQMVYMPMDIPQTWHKHFYKWAADNNIPF
jgi:hypothetical protein